MSCGDAVSIVDIAIQNNVFWTDVFQFGTTTDDTWDFSGKRFQLDVKRRATDSSALLSLTSAAGEILISDISQRILSMYVSDVDIRASLPVDRYVYDLIMIDNSTGQRDALMAGTLEVEQGVTI